jgi:hypothetical protein
VVEGLCGCSCGEVYDEETEGGFDGVGFLKLEETCVS